MRDPMDRSQRLTDGTRWRIFMRLLPLDDMMTSYTNARPEADLLVVDIELSMASGLLASRSRPEVRFQPSLYRNDKRASRTGDRPKFPRSPLLGSFV